MGIEAWAVRRRVPGVAVQRVGIGARDWDGGVATPLVVSLGLAGGLAADLSPGTVVVAGSVAHEDGAAVDCDRAFSASLAAASRRLGHPTAEGAMLTATGLVTGADRGRWAARGFLAVDMESSFLAGHGAGLAVVRVILDTPQHELSPKWEHPWRALLDPRLAREAIWLLPHSRRFALRAADVLAEALRREVHAQV